MKNIHIVPTPNPSRLYKFEGKLIKNDLIGLYNFEEKGYIAQNIYITSDEEIKDGDWFIFKDDNTYLFQSIGNTDNTHIKVKSINAYGYGDWNKDYCKKIILTTDQDLVKDGVQAIDDKFLEWFVAHPSCEEVETEITDRDNNGYGIPFGGIFYKIIIPSEVPKQELKVGDNTNFGIITDIKEKSVCFGKNKVGVDVWYKKSDVKLVPKQETTLEEFIESQPYYGTCTYEYKEGIEVGAKWQQERSYSEEEVLGFGKFCVDKIADFLDGKGDQTDGKEYSMEELLEQFKKK